MSVFHKKDRMVSFRLSGPEYALAELSCFKHGVRSVSSLARDAVLNLMNGGKREYSAADAEILIQLQHQVLTLRAELDKLAGMVYSPQPASVPLVRNQAAGD